MQCVPVPCCDNRNGDTLPLSQPHPAVPGKGDRARKVCEPGLTPPGLTAIVWMNVLPSPTSLLPMDNAWVSAAIKASRQCETVGRRLAPRKNFPTDKKVMVEWRGTSRDPRIWERFTSKYPTPYRRRQALV